MNRTFKIIGATVVTLAILAVVALIVYVRLVHRGSDPDLPEQPILEEFIQSGFENPDYGTQVFTMRLATTLETDVYEFTGNYIEVNVACRIEGDAEASSNYFSVELHRIDAGFIDTLVGSQTLLRRGPSFAVFTDIPSGDYYLRFVKDADGQMVVSDAVRVQGFVVQVDDNSS